MEQEFLIDSNTVIDYLGKKLPSSATAFIDKLPATISVITRIEIMGWYNATPAQLAKLQPFIQDAFVYPLVEAIIQQTILLRQMYKIKLPDAIVAATALIEDLSLITRNTDDFKNIPDLDLLNPWNM